MGCGGARLGPGPGLTMGYSQPPNGQMLPWYSFHSELMFEVKKVCNDAEKLFLVVLKAKGRAQIKVQYSGPYR